MHSMFHSLKMRLLGAVFLLSLGLPACTPAPQAPLFTATAAPRGELTPFYTATASGTPTPPDPATPTPLPSPTPTLRSHTIRRGEDLGGIASLYRVSLQALLDANPGIDPYLLKVGDALNLPASSEQTTPEAPLPTPVQIALGAVSCTAGKDGGAWCFALVHNDRSTAVESVSAVMRVAGGDGSQVRSQVAVAPLDLLPPGASLPLAAYFSPPLPSGLQASAELLTALPVPADDRRYLPVRIEDLQVSIDADGLSAEASGRAALEATEGRASVVWIAALAYDREGRVVGMRRWENKDPLPAGEGLAFRLQVYSTGGEIERVEALAQARP